MPAASKIELHFYFVDESHTMDAVVRNENEKELLAILKAIISTFGFPITIDSEASQHGGFRQFWILAGESSAQINAILSLASFFISTKPKKEKAALTGEKLVEVPKKKTQVDKAKKELRENEKFHQDTFKEIINLLEANPRLIWHRSNFYKKVNSYLKIERFSTTLLDGNEIVGGSEKSVVRKSFNSFIVNSNELPPNVDEDAIVEIVAPVLTTAKSKWKGIYKGSPITFDIKDDEFKKSVFGQRIEFKNGVAIKCALQLVQNIDGRGVIKTKSITVLSVAGIIHPDSAIITIDKQETPAPIIPAVPVALPPVAPKKVRPPVVVEEPVIAPVQKKIPKVDDRQLDMFA